MRVIQGTATDRRPTPLEEAYAHFRLDRQGLPVSPRTLGFYDDKIGGFLAWLRREHTEVRRFEDLDVTSVRLYRAQMAARPGLRGRQIQPETLAGTVRALRAFFRWAHAEGYQVAPRILQLPRVRVPWKEPTLYHMTQVRDLLAACNPTLPQEALAVRILLGSGVRQSELCGLAIQGPDGLSDLMLESLDRGVVELRVRGDAGAKGMRARRIPVVPKLGSEIRRYVVRHRPEVAYPALLINSDGRPYRRWGIDSMMDRLQDRVGFRVHAHAFRHTFATVASQLGWNFERLRAAMGHED
jgi:integrase